jgi:small subunit ribosomal protein S16
MATTIRLARGGAKKKPFYRIVVADSRKPVTGDFIERIGTFNPLLPRDSKERLVVNQERASHWLKTGAVPSDRIARLFSDLGLTEKPSAAGKPQKGRKKPEKLTRKEKAAAAEAEAKAKAAEEAAAAKAAAEAEAAEAEAAAAPAAEEAPAA